VTWHQDGAKKFASTRSDDRTSALRELRTRLQAAGRVRRTITRDPQKVSYQDLRDSFLARDAYA
jgi:hypothetical protein